MGMVACVDGPIPRECANVRVKMKINLLGPLRLKRV